ncbi:LysR family transcriptional regulator [Anatilimnocola sp. NA78]|uniref:LysR family transcriptional regulator n=1 Tax=Anatilimnocola sp. NA78 TaxID=3415683 RepID=UPI003CE4AF42
MQLKSLKLFCDIVGRRSFSRAAAENGISQSGASQVVNTLEEELGVKLLDRTRRPFQLTPEGEVYYDGCRKMVQQYFALEEQVRTLHAEVAGRVSIASIYSIGLSHMNRFVQSFLKLHPKANVRVQYQHPHRVYELVETDQVDLGLVSFPRSTRAIKATLWREEPMVLVCAPSHPLAQKERVTLQDLQDQVMVAFESDLEIRAEIDRALEDAGVEVRVSMEFDNTETIKRAVEIDAGISLLPQPTVDRELAAGALVARPLTGTDLKRPIGIIQRRGKELGQTAQRFMQSLLKHPATATLDTVSENAVSENAALDSAFEIATLDQEDEQDDTDVATTDVSSARRLHGEDGAAAMPDEATASRVAIAERPKVS